MRINYNLMALNAMNNLNVVTGKKAKSSEKLSSGYRINRAADDAAGLAISEKMRRQIRGLRQGTQNAVDGISWVQIGDGALNEAHDVLHRMTQLTVQSLNGTYTNADRMAMELEFESLQSELDRISTSTKFNDMNIFEQHEIPYYQCEGDVKWDPQQMHVVTDGQNDLIFKYRETEDAPPKTMTVTVPAGEYTTQELIDEIDDVLGGLNTGKEKIVFEFTPEGYCNANLEGGEAIDSVSGSLSYLLYDMYKGGGYGALIGTTSFPNEYSALKVVNGQNDFMSFTIEDFSGGSRNVEIDIPEGSYTRSQLIEYLNNQLAGTGVEAIAYGTGIKLSSDEAIVTGFKGNMFKIDGAGTVYNSVFYDNVKYGAVTQTAAYFNGGYVLPTDSRDEEHKYYKIDSSNNTLTLQPNGMANSVTLTISDGNYTADDMADELNRLFAAEGLELKAEKISSGGFEGMRIVSDVKGLDSEIHIDAAGSSAYNTLFVTREYNQYGAKIQPVNQTRADSEGVFKGSKDLSSEIPLTITAGDNDSFKISINDAEYNISLSAGTYNSVADIVDELNNQLNGASALAGYKDKITASAVSGKIVLTGNEGQSVNKIRVTAVAGNNGFEDIFQGYRTVSTTQNVSGTGSVTLNTPFDGNIDPSESNMTITVDGINYNVTLPTGNVTQNDVKDAVEEAIPPRTVVTDNKFTAVSDTGESGNRNFTSTAEGKDTPVFWSGDAVGSSEEQEGVVGFISSNPAVLTIDIPLQNSMPVDALNNTLVLTLNGRTETITLDEGTYNPTSLKNALQSKIDEAFGTDMGGATVGISDNRLVLTSRLPDGADGALTSISCATATSNFLKELNTTRTPAQWTSNLVLASGITIDDSNQSFVFTYTENGNTQNINLTLGKGTYSPASIVTELNQKLAATGTGITASLSNTGRLVLTSAAVGDDVSIKYGTTTGGNSAEALFGPLTQPSPAKVVVGLKTEETIDIVAGTSDTFSITVNGTKQTVTLDAGSYDRAGFVNMLNEKLTAAGAGAQAYVSGTMLGFQTTATGTQASISVNYNNGGNAMKAIYGVTTTEYSGVTVNFDTDGKMVLGTTRPTSTILVQSGSGGAFQQPEVTSQPIAVTYTDGYHSAQKSYIDGVNLSGDITIDEWNNNLNFTFLDNGTGRAIAIEIPEAPNGAYTYDELQTKLQELIDAQAGTGKINVTVSAAGVRLEAANTGSKYQFSNFSGDFYDKVICTCTERILNRTVTDVKGNQIVDAAYTIGRKDVKNGVVTIRYGINDEMSLDLTYGGTVHKISVTLDAGEYGADRLKTQLQDKINEQLKALGLEENLIEVGIGGISSGVYGSNDQNALNFSLSKNIKAPDEGPFIIDGVSGSAAFEIFYQTDGKMEPAYIRGSKDVSQGVTIEAGETDLTFLVDGTSYTVNIPEGDYTAEELLDAVNAGFSGANAPLVAELDEGRLRISHKKMGEHDIQEVSGGAKYTVFFSENGQIEPDDARFVKLSSQENDEIPLKRHIFNTAYLGLNSCCISRPKYAQKALERLNEALQMISDIRSDFGSTQNRIEHAINNNQNREENLQSAESVIRDTDMAKEMVAYSNHNILAQAGQAMLAQANHGFDGVLTLLQ